MELRPPSGIYAGAAAAAHTLYWDGPAPTAADIRAEMREAVSASMRVLSDVSRLAWTTTKFLAIPAGIGMVALILFMNIMLLWPKPEEKSDPPSARFEHLGAFTNAAGETLPTAHVRQGQPTQFHYRFRPLGEESAELHVEANRELTEYLARNDSVGVQFACYPCDLDPDSLGVRQIQSEDLAESELVFAFTPIAPQRDGRSALDIRPHIALTFLDGGALLDRWVIPLRVLGPEEVAPDTSASAQVSSRTGEHSIYEGYAVRMPSRVIRFTFTAASRTTPMAVEMRAPNWASRYLPDDPALQVRRDSAGFIVSAPLRTTPARFSGLVQRMMGSVEGAMQNAFSSDLQLGAEDTSSPCAFGSDPAENQAASSEAFRNCIRERALNVRDAMLPDAMRQFLYNLARCGSVDEDTLSLVVFSGHPPAPLQLLPVDEVHRGQLDHCDVVGGADERAQTTAPSDDYWGLHFPLVSLPVVNEDLFDTDGPPNVSPLSPQLLAGIYAAPSGANAAPDIDTFNAFAQFVSGRARATVVRDGRQFLTAIRDRRGDIDLIVTNTHGIRRPPYSNELIFSDLSTYAINPEVAPPPGSVVNATDLYGQLNSVTAVGQIGLSRRPSVILLACDLACRDDDEFCIPSVFLTFGAESIIAAEASVPSSVAHDLGRMLVERIGRGDPAPIALLQARQEYFRTHHSVFPLLWGIVGAEGLY
ncbi:hypothetical protein U91I_00468 [alpha proteobacterium U9-1i]|nr:hypothetical protein U91I_00468 [alpha proteobacterium U9-1i]